MPFNIDKRGNVIVYQWTGIETSALRMATRLSVRKFAARLGVNPRTVSKWEAGGADITLRPETQEMMDTMLRRARGQAPIVSERFTTMLREKRPKPKPVLVAATGGNSEQIKPPAKFVPQAVRIITPPGGVIERPPAKLWDDPRLADVLEHRVIKDLYRYLQATGYSQRHIAALTGQSQSEISEVLGGRRIRHYDVLVRIADGLGHSTGTDGVGVRRDRAGRHG